MPYPRTCLLALPLLAVLAAPAQAQSQWPTLKIENAAVRVVVIPEARADLAVSVRAGAARLPAVKVSRQGAVTIIDGGLTPGLVDRMKGRPAAADCEGTMVVAGGGRWRADQLPVVTVRAPMTVKIESVGAVLGQVGAADYVSLNDKGCGDWALGDTPNLSLVHDGAGTVRARQVTAGLAVQVNGAGTVIVAGGFTAHADLLVKGKGRIDHKGTIGQLNGAVNGAGLVTVGLVSGTVEKEVRGSGDVRYTRPANRSYKMGN